MCNNSTLKDMTLKLIKLKGKTGKSNSLPSTIDRSMEKEQVNKKLAGT